MQSIDRLYIGGFSVITVGVLAILAAGQYKAGLLAPEVATVLSFVLSSLAAFAVAWLLSGAIESLLKTSELRRPLALSGALFAGSSVLFVGMVWTPEYLVDSVAVGLMLAALVAFPVAAETPEFDRLVERIEAVVA